MLLLGAQFLFEVGDALLEFGEAVERSHHAEPLAIFDGGIAGIERTFGDIVGDAALRGDDRAVAHCEMAGGADLAREDAVIADARGASEANLTAKHGVATDLGGVTDEDEIVDLCAAADTGFADGGAVDAGVGLDFDVVFKDGGAGLNHFVPGAVGIFCVAEAVAADDDSVLQNDAVADFAEFADDGVSVGEEVSTDAHAAINSDETVQDGVFTEDCVFLDETVRADMRAGGDSGGRRDHRGGVNTRRVFWDFVEKFDCLGEGEIRIWGAELGEGGFARIALDFDAVFDKNGGGARGLQIVPIAAIGEEGNFTGSGLLDAGHAVDFGVRITL